MAQATSTAVVQTANPRRYLGQLCKHFQHKIPVELAERHGRIAFAAGVCEVEAPEGDTQLRLRVTANDAEGLPGLEDVVARHLVRFAFRENLELTWTRAD